MNSHSSIKTIRWMLEQWARWAYSNRGLSIGYPSIEPFARLRGGTVKDPLISDDDAETVDRLVSELRLEHPRVGEAVATYYLVRQNYKVVGKIIGADHRRVAMLVQSGEMWLDGRVRI